MAAIRNVREKKGYKNYISCLVAANKTGEVLEPFTVDGLQQVHNQISNALGPLPACVNQCSRTERSVFNRWCHTCLHWKTQLEGHFAPVVNRNQIKWKKLQSWKWPNGAREIAEVYLVPGWNTNNIDLQDLSTSLNIWERCTGFPRQLVAPSRVLRRTRNELAHCARMKITTQRKAIIFQNIRAVGSNQQLMPFIQNYQAYVQMLQDLEQGRLFNYENEIINALNSIARHYANIDIKLDRIALGLRIHHNILEQIQQKVNRKLVKIACVVIILLLLVFFVFVLTLLTPTCLLIYSQHLESGTVTKDTYALGATYTDGCLSENTDGVYPGNLNLFEYLSHHRNFVGRDWLFRILEYELFRTENRGILLEAGMGYGKSALVAHLICANNGSSAFFLRKELVAYHVCRFDVFLSKKAHIFIFRLLAMLANRIPELSDSIKSCREVYDKNLCEEDKYGCLDHCVIAPLKSLPNSQPLPLVIAIDALDECYDIYLKENPIFLLLKNRNHRFPSWIKFVVTSRYFSEEKQLRIDFKVIQLTDDDESNRRDVMLYLQMSRSNVVEKSLKSVTKFLIVTSYVENNMTNATLPKTLDRFYDEQFVREFGPGSPSNFTSVKCLLEVVISAFQALEEKFLFKIVSFSCGMSESTFTETIKRFDNFLTVFDNRYHLKHISLQEWLTTTKNDQFKIYITNGHNMNAKFYLDQVFYGNITFVNIVDLCMHIGLSGSKILREKFLSLSGDERLDFFKTSTNEYPIIELARRVDSYEIMDIFTSLFEDLSTKNSKSFTAAFVAASFGHTQSLKALVNKGADITVRTDSFENLITLDIAVEVSFEYKFWGYGVLDIAAQNGHSQTVEYILDNDGVMFDYPLHKLNSMMLLPIHLACKRGHLLVVKRLAAAHPWMLDWQCLYYSAEYGYDNLVTFLLEAGKRDECRPCKTYLHWLPTLAVRVQGEFLSKSEKNDTLVLFDDWMNITCESSLHVAVRQNRKEIVALLLKQKDNAAECFDRGGRTPLIAAIQYGHKDIVSVFALHGKLTVKEKCGDEQSLNDSFKLNRAELKKLTEYVCSRGTDILHIAAKFDREWIFSWILEHYNKVDWNKRDLKGCHLLHHAACHSSTKTLFFFESLKLIEQGLSQQQRCKNGSTPLHSAVLCRSVAATEFMLKYIDINKETDSDKRELLLQTVIFDVDVETVKESDDIEKNLTTIFQMLLTNESMLFVKDRERQNIMHLLIQKGHFGVLNFIFCQYSSASEKLLTEENSKQQKPLNYAIHSLPTKSEFDILALFEFCCGNSTESDMNRKMASPKEYSLMMTLKFFRSRKLVTSLPQSVIKTLIKKQSVYLLIYIFSKSKTVLYDSNLSSDILTHDKFGLISMLYYMILAKQRPDMFSCRTCNEILKKCKLHNIALTYSRVAEIISIFPAFEILHDVLLKMLFQPRFSHLMSTCYDEDGFNVLERAIQSGSIHLVKYLLAINVKSKVKKDKLILMALDSGKYTKYDRHFVYLSMANNQKMAINFISVENVISEITSGEKFRQNSALFLYVLTRSELPSHMNFFFKGRHKSDNFTSFLIKTFQSGLKRSKVCKEATKEFSLVHRLALEGYTNSLKLVASFWGKDTLKCQNLDLFTPLYLSTVFNFSDTFIYMSSVGINLQYPNQDAGFNFLHYIAFLFVLPGEEMKCISNKKEVKPNDLYGMIKLYKCLNHLYRFTNEYDGNNQLFVSQDLKWFISLHSATSLWLKLQQAKPSSWICFLRSGCHPQCIDSNKAFEIDKLKQRACRYIKEPFYRLFLMGAKIVNKSTDEFKGTFKTIHFHLGTGITETVGTLNDIINDIEQYEWNDDNCTNLYISYMNAESKIRSFLFNFIYTNVMFMLKSIKQSIKVGIAIDAYKHLLYRLPGATGIVTNSSLKAFIFSNTYDYNRYAYMRDISTSNILRSSVSYLVSNVSAFLDYQHGFLKFSKLTLFGMNADAILRNYIKDINVRKNRIPSSE